MLNGSHDNGLNGSAKARALVEGVDYDLIDRDEPPGQLFAARTQAVAAQALGIGVRTLREWLAAGAPGKPGRYVIADLFWWDMDRRAGGSVCRECLHVKGRA